MRRARYKGEWKPACQVCYKRIWRTGEPVAGLKAYQRRNQKLVRQEQARRLKSAGLTNKEIAEQFGVTPRSVRRWRMSQ